MVSKQVVVAGDQIAYPHRGQHVTLHYTASIYGGKKFDCSRENGTPFMFQVGNGEVIRGWEQIIETMSIGERSRIVVPPEFAYGSKGFYDIVPPGSTIIFDLELLKIETNNTIPVPL